MSTQFEPINYLGQNKITGIQVVSFVGDTDFSLGLAVDLKNEKLVAANGNLPYGVVQNTSQLADDTYLVSVATKGDLLDVLCADDATLEAGALISFQEGKAVASDKGILKALSVEEMQLNNLADSSVNVVSIKL